MIQFKATSVEPQIIEKAAGPLGLDAARLQLFVEDVERNIRAFVKVNAELTTLPPENRVADAIDDEIAFVEQARDRIFERLNGRERRIDDPMRPEDFFRTDDPVKAEELAAQAHGVLSEIAVFLKARASVLRAWKPRSKNAAQPRRDLLWDHLIELWVTAGGKDSGNDAARFLIDVSRPLIRNTPSEPAVVEWLRKRRNARLNG